MSKYHSIAKFRRANARRLRAKSTNAEALLWRHLKKMETFGTHFRRQVSIGPYFADFACMAARLVIEVDGSQHGIGDDKLKDDNRTGWLETEGYRVLRFWNNDIVANIDGVVETIYAAVYGSRESEPYHLKHLRRRKSHPTPARSTRRPSPSRGG